ncbi:TPA: DNA-directed RNA polymerase subunit beta [Streptococcus suis]|uniref:DNA-directed RNA polymerase subunit beta n=1 Tax=Streptococcus suis TaxID=1307 RepID=UPI00211D594A|nr:DNA-directed RNA polymerase subunit beta [Streptococcus suis]UUM58223.1 DNA-directed RNA polymerase subunit beta [Streptococcus suis]HEL2576635.1 DNA-directed RNA polymerase subunit beta [Streptococcus suis]
MDKEQFGYIKKQLLIVLLVLLAMFLLFAVGLMIGYGVIGDGDNIWSVLSPEKWQELINKFTGK